MRNELRATVQDAIDGLGADQAGCVRGFYVEGATCQELAAQLGISDNAVKKRLSGARESLRRRLRADVEAEPVVEAE